MTVRCVPLVLLALGCHPEPEDSTPPAGAVVELEDANVVPLHSELWTSTVAAAAGADVILDWSGLDVDLAGRALDPAKDVVRARLYVFGTTGPEEILQGLATGQLPQADVGLMAAQELEGTDCALSGFELLGHWVVPGRDFVEGSGTWLVELLGAEGIGLRAVVLLEPTEGGELDTVAVLPGSSSLEVELDLGRAEPVGGVGGADATLDWSAVTTSSLGDPDGLGEVDRLVISRHAAFGEQPASLLALEPEVRWSMALDGRQSQASLAELEGTEPFEGLDGEHRWLLELACGGCTLPVPALLAELGPEGGG
jgi:hypothetical protein